jgi:hypothetical protein
MDTLRPLAHTQVQFTRPTTTVSIRWDHMESVSGVSQSEPHKLVIPAGSVRPNATKVDQSANIAKTIISSAFTGMCRFRNRTNKRKQ